jgi:hypothetical protein
VTRARLLLASALVALLLTPTVAAERTVRVTCRDGVLPSPRRACDADQACDGVCTFVLSSGQTFITEHPVVVPVGRKSVVAVSVAFLPTRYILRCRRHTKRLPCPTTAPPPPSICTTDTDCRVAGNPCVTGFCEAGMCQRACACIPPNSLFTCFPEEAIRCPNPDCRGVPGDPCRHCDDNGLCVTNGFCG